MSCYTLLCCYFTLLLAASGTRSPINSDSLAQSTELDAKGSNSKSITYIRHGQSTGNAHVKGMLHTKSLFNFHKDGVLMPKGIQQVKDRVNLMGGHMLARVIDAQVILTSPLRRALSTAVLFVAHAHHRKVALERARFALNAPKAGCSVDSKTEGYQLSSDYRWPTMQVVAELREKVKSKSEIPGSGIGSAAPEYLMNLARELGSKLFCNEMALVPMVQDLLLSFERDKNRTESWTTHRGSIGVPADGVTFGQLIRAFTKDILPARHEERVVIVGHSGWARFAFAHLLPPPSGSALDDPLDNLNKFSRTTLELNNAGILPVRFHEGIYRYDWLDEPQPENKNFPNFKQNLKVNMWTLLPDASFFHVIPRDAIATQFYFADESRIVTISASKSEGVAFCTRSSEWGVPEKEETFSLGAASTQVVRYRTNKVKIHEQVPARKGLVTKVHKYVFPNSAKRDCFYSIVRWYQDYLRLGIAERPQCEGAVDVN